MANERYPQDDYYNRSETQDYGRDYGSGRSQSYSSARSYQAAENDGDRERGGRDRDDRDRGDYGRRDYGNQRYGQREGSGYGSYGQGSYGQGGYGRDDGGRGGRDYGRADRDVGSGRDSGYYQGGSDRSGGGFGQGPGDYRGSYASDGRRFENAGRYRDTGDEDRRGQQGGDRYGRQPQGYANEERGFFDRAGDEVRSWFGDEQAERRREQDARRDEQDAGERYGNESDSHYRNWRRTQMEALDRDYDEYRQQNRSKFESEFGTWRTGRQGQRDLLNKVEEHQEVVGSDGEHVGTVDKVRGDRVILTKNDKDAGGHHHSFPSSWLQSADGGTVTLSRTAADAKAAWKDEERKGAMFSGQDDRSGYGAGQQATGQQSAGQQASGQQASGTAQDDADGKGGLNRSFSGTY